MKFVSKNQQGFTLLELLVVVGIIAIIGGAMISSFSGNEAKAARGVATQTIAGVENSIRLFVTSTDRLPNNLESLVCAPYSATGVVSTAAWATGATTDPKSTAAILATTADPLVAGATALAATAYKFGGISNVSGIGGGMGKKLAQKFVGTNLTSDEVTEMTDRGLLSLRYAISEACDDDASNGVSVTVNGLTANFGGTTNTLADIDIPNQAFSDPRPGSTAFNFRGVGFEGVVATGAPVLMWYKGSDVLADGTLVESGYNNVKVGAGAHDRLLAFGIGSDSDLVGTDTDSVFGKAPFYGQIGKDKYAHYIGLFNTGTYTTDGTDSAAPEDINTRIQAVIDARGDFLDEEIAEFNGQKL